MDADVVIIGAGPNGLMLACELGLAGLAPVVLEALPGPAEEPKANGLLGQVVKLVERRGLYERIAGDPGPPRPTPSFPFAAMPLDLHRLDDNPVHTLAIPQPRLVRILADRAAELGARFRWGHAMTGLAQDADAVTVDVTGPDGPYRMAARYLAGADGGHSVTRKQCGIGFPGVSYDRSMLRWAHVSVPADRVDAATGGLDVPGYGIVPPFLAQRTEHGGFTYAPLPGRPPIIATTELDQPVTDAPMTLAELRDSIRRVLGADVPVGPPDGDGPHLLRRRVGGSNRRAERFRDGRVFLLGDAAHVDAAGGQGLNQGMQDAANLGWKLAAALRGDAPDGLLDTYDTERQLAARRVTMYAQALAALLAPGDDVTALRALFGELLGDRDTVRRLAGLTAGTDVRYDMGAPGPHPLTGYSAPDLDLRTGTGPVRLADLTRTARPLLLDLSGHGTLAAAMADWADRVDVLTATTTSDVTGLLLRPDCYVAWATSAPEPSEQDLAGLRDAAVRWFGVPVAGAVAP